MTNFGIFFFPNPEEGAKEIYRTLQKGGTAVVTCWKVLGLIPLFYECQKIIEPARPVLSLPVLEKWRERETMKNCLKAGGFKEVVFETKATMITGENDAEMLSATSGVSTLLLLNAPFCCARASKRAN